MAATRPRYAVRREENLPARMRDGTVLRADLYRPQTAGPFPVLLLQTAYRKRHPDTVGLVERLAAHGYLVAVQCLRGRYESEGDFEPFFAWGGGETTARDGYDSVEWAAGLPDSTGQVGVFGTSIDSWALWKLAPTRPPHLAAMFAGGMSADSRDVWPGVFRRERQLRQVLCNLVPDTRRRLNLPGPWTGAEAWAAFDRVERGKWLWFEPLADFPPSALGGLASFWRDWLSHHHEDLFGFAERHAEIDVPVYHLTSWYDRFLGTIDQYLGMAQNGRSERARRSQKLIVGPWTHGFDLARRVGVMDFGPEAELDCAKLMAAWFGHCLKGLDHKLLDEPPIRLFVMGRNRWRNAQAWPPTETRPLEYYLHSGGAANTPQGGGRLDRVPPGEEPPDRYLYDPRDPVMSVALPNGQDGPGDLRVLDGRRDLLVFQSPPLERELEVIGPVEVRLFAASSAPDTDWTARLVDVHPDGRAINLCYGIQRARYRDSWEQPSLIEPGRVYEYTIRLRPTANLFKVGHRLRVDVSSSDFPNYDRNHNTGRDDWQDGALAPARQSVFHEGRYPSRVILPIVAK